MLDCVLGSHFLRGQGLFSCRSSVRLEGFLTVKISDGIHIAPLAVCLGEQQVCLEVGVVPSVLLPHITVQFAGPHLFSFQLSL
jgi:hypothetical protein